MRTATILHRDMQAFLARIFGPGLVDDRYMVERFRSMADSEMRRRSGEGQAQGEDRVPAGDPADAPRARRGIAAGP